MPELPEVETVVRGLQQTITGKSFSEVRVLHPKPLGSMSSRQFQIFIKAETVQEVSRFGKYIQICLRSGKSLICHLRMTGKFIALAGPIPSGQDLSHVRLIFTFSDGSCLFFKDVRIFGTIRAYHKDEPIAEKLKTGVEPLSPTLTVDYLLKRAAGRRVPLKVFLLDQKIIAGLGNIYVCEILFHCRLTPFMETQSLTSVQAELLIKQIRRILKLAIRNNGTSIRDFQNIDSKSGRFQNWLRVYGKQGTLCRGCRQTEIRREVQAQRGTFYCPVCQR